MDRLLIVDATNVFVRNFMAMSTMDINGNAVGGITGFLYNLASYINNMAISKILLCWDGVDSTHLRRKIYKQYKAGRKSHRHNRSFDVSEDENAENKEFQQKLLRNILRFLPVIQLEMEYIEADDVIAVLCRHYHSKQKIIVSTDKDFRQLLDCNTVIYNPMKKQYITHITSLSECGVHSENYAIFKSLIGDKSDNIHGMKQIGAKNVLKLIPIIGEAKKIQLDEIVEFCLKSKSKICQNIVHDKEKLYQIYNIIQLHNPIIPISSIDAIINRLECDDTKFESVAIRMAMSDITTFDVEQFIRTINRFLYVNRGKEEINNGIII